MNVHLKTHLVLPRLLCFNTSLFLFNCETSNSACVNHDWICATNQYCTKALKFLAHGKRLWWGSNWSWTCIHRLGGICTDHVASFFKDKRLYLQVKVILINVLGKIFTIKISKHCKNSKNTPNEFIRQLWHNYSIVLLHASNDKDQGKVYFSLNLSKQKSTN